MNLQMLQQQRNTLDKTLRNAVYQLNKLPAPCCLNCRFFDQVKQYCDQFNDHVPSNFTQQIEQCDRWEFDGLPAIAGDLTVEQAMKNLLNL